jgi:glutaredoxin 3
MADVKIYTTPWCPYCHRAKALLSRKGVAFTEIDVDGDSVKRQWLAQVTGQRTVPQVFIDGKSVGGCDDIHALDGRGELDRLLGRA